MLAVTRELAERLCLASLSDPGSHPQLRAAFGPEYPDRPDGWHVVSTHYGISPHTLAAEKPSNHIVKQPAGTDKFGILGGPQHTEQIHEVTR
jgi:glycine betaine/choline ABC-type transport system substrate-binding protein